MLTAKQERFVTEYIKDFRGTDAAIRAGYSAKGADSYASQLLSMPNVKSELAQRQAKLAARAEIKGADVLAEMHKLAMSNMGDYMKVGANGYPNLDFSSLTRDQTAALSEVTVDEYQDGKGDEARPVKKVKFKLYDKINALTKLGQHLGLFVETDKSGPGLKIDAKFLQVVVQAAQQAQPAIRDL